MQTNIPKDVILNKVKGKAILKTSGITVIGEVPNEAFLIMATPKALTNKPTINTIYLLNFSI